MKCEKSKVKRGWKLERTREAFVSAQCMSWLRLRAMSSTAAHVVLPRHRSAKEKKRQQGVESSSSRVKPWQTSSPYFTQEITIALVVELDPLLKSHLYVAHWYIKKTSSTWWKQKGGSLCMQTDFLEGGHKTYELVIFRQRCCCYASTPHRDYSCFYHIINQ